MSVLNTLPAPIVQMGLVEKVVEVQQNQATVQQLVAQTTTRQELKEAHSRVPRTDGAENGKKVQDRESGQNRKGGNGAKHRKEEPQPNDGENTPESQSARTKPWSGQLVNLKV